MKSKCLPAALCVLICTIIVLPDATAQKASVEDCKKLKQRIDQFRELRRKGGPGKQMDAWKRALRESEKAFRAQGCSTYD